MLIIGEITAKPYVIAELAQKNATRCPDVSVRLAGSACIATSMSTNAVETSPALRTQNV